MAAVHDGPSRLIQTQVPAKVLEQDLGAFQKSALELGASMAEIIPANWIEIDERVRLKCSIPLCPYYGKSLHCPPHSPSLDRMRSILARYSFAILFALDVVPPNTFSGGSEERKAAAQWAHKCFEITGNLERTAFGNGYYLAMGFAQASCIKALCGQEKCLVLDGGKCPYPLQSRPSMESTGMDVYRLVRKVGWEIYPIYRSVDPKQVPRALSVGVVLVY